MYRCPRCSTIIEEDVRFCDNCGLRMPPPGEEKSSSSEGRASLANKSDLKLYPSICSACGHENVPGEMFCDNCGVQLAPVASIPPPPPVPNLLPLSDLLSNNNFSETTTNGNCSHCGKPNNSGSEFCQNCGTQLTRSAIRRKDSESISNSIKGNSVADQNQTIKLGEELFQADQITGKFILSGTEDEIELPSDKTELLIGRTDIARNEFPEIDLVPFGGDKFGVSRKHAMLVARDSRLFIKDLNSTNFTFINNERLLPGKCYLLNTGDEVRFGLLVLKFKAEEQY